MFCWFDFFIICTLFFLLPQRFLRFSIVIYFIHHTATDMVLNICSIYKWQEFLKGYRFPISIIPCDINEGEKIEIWRLWNYFTSGIFIFYRLKFKLESFFCTSGQHTTVLLFNVKKETLLLKAVSFSSETIKYPFLIKN